MPDTQRKVFVHVPDIPINRRGEVDEWSISADWRIRQLEQQVIELKNQLKDARKEQDRSLRYWTNWFESLFTKKERALRETNAH